MCAAIWPPHTDQNARADRIAIVCGLGCMGTHGHGRKKEEEEKEEESGPQVRAILVFVCLSVYEPLSVREGVSFLNYFIFVSDARGSHVWYEIRPTAHIGVRHFVDVIS